METKNHPKRSTSQAGFSVVEVVIVIAVILLIFLLGWYVYNHRHKHTQAANTSNSSSVKATTKATPKTSKPSTTTSTGSAVTPTTKSTATTKSTTTTKPEGTPNCATTDLTLSLGQFNGGGGTEYMNVVLTNSSAASCNIGGFPNVALTDSGGNTIGSAATQDGSSNGTITLAANQSAYSSVGFPLNNGEQCSSETSSDIEVTPPNDTAGLQTSLSGQQYCQGFSVTALQPGDGN
ncbi:MAG TPA: DUF4232 domain-containing protein [Candidatus Saccharimonadales bacterium]|nr:DUF4232 domain-containing protein [Candidatus Saccharimonadales bacterium]